MEAICVEIYVAEDFATCYGVNLAGGLTSSSCFPKVEPEGGLGRVPKRSQGGAIPESRPGSTFERRWKRFALKFTWQKILLLAMG